MSTENATDPQKSIVDRQKSMADRQKGIVDPQKSIVDAQKGIVDPPYENLRAASSPAPINVLMYRQASTENATDPQKENPA